MNKAKILVIIALVIAGGAIVYIRGKNSSARPQYQTAKTEKGTIVSSVSASGQILESNFLNMATQATGIVKTVYAKNGDRVYAGQKIAEIELDADGKLKNAQAWASLVAANNSLNAARNNYRLTQATVQRVYDDIKGHDADETFTQKETRTKAEVANDNAYDNVKNAEVNLVSANLAYRLTSPVITAPVAGTIDNITLAAGMTVGTGRVAVVRRQGNPITSFNVSEVDVNRVTPGQKATVTLDSISGKTFTGKVATVDKIGTVTSGVTNYPVIISLDTTAPEILPNMAATANIIIEAKNDALLVPSEAVDDQQVRVLKDGRMKNVTVETGLSSDTQTEIVAGLSEGDEVITGTVTNGNQSPFSTFRFGTRTR
ncbi:MAG: Efflux transporter, RND family, MFP subunit [Candidatus Amesbacteria bacterium GW2011_GWA1_47_20]|uniref:Efflux transporter, RND family, MFP subunit n=2 Tax=Candidatus Amesiibacteriota TaxID=1752730 RepID=A0A0G1UV23_9BACT|nr:MAG: Efflux transporter, RND family, MFP subunit [Microgenomates group bacterium GW2011_GWC1_46_20]KKU69893.1 MAG: Efflux transporter, RND family, MFP subunit [Candidatus Amesbacteria bacterium GW2011_GWA1_47_20]KKU84798.1 MAG: Efflux transporter, RND family, MFP subunit [Candidatus Amesbacteria bacterium GW2011_GWC2_47_8]